MKIKNIIFIFFLILFSTVLVDAANFTLVGNVISNNQKIITSRYMGFVTKVGPSAGEKVKKGELLYSIDSKEIDSEKIQVELGIEQAKLAFSMSKNRFLNTKLNLDRYKRLYKKDMVAKYQVENLELATKNLKDMMKIANKQVQQAKAKLSEVENQYKYLQIKAPNNAVVVARNIKVGEMAMPGMPAYILTDLNDLRISAEVSENNLKYVTIGKKVLIEIPSVGLKEKGVVSAIIPNLNPLTHTFKIKVKFNKQGKNIYPGMYAKVIVE